MIISCGGWKQWKGLSPTRHPELDPGPAFLLNSSQRYSVSALLTKLFVTVRKPCQFNLFSIVESSESLSRPWLTN